MAELREILMPEHLMEIPEFRLVVEVGDAALEKIDDELQNIHDDTLITTATLRGIRRREKIIGLMSDPDESTESRRAKVLFWWYNRLPYTEKLIRRMIEALCGADNYTLDYDVENELLKVGIGLNLGWNVINTVHDLLEDLIMLNVILDVRGTDSATVEPVVHVGIAHREYSNQPLISDNV